MKKIIALLMMASIVLLVACSGSTGSRETSEPTTEPAQITFPAELSVEEIYDAFIESLTTRLHKIIGDDTYIDGFDSQEGMLGLYEIASVHRVKMLDKLGYKIEDINGDGTAELFIYEVDELTETSRKGTRILCGFTVIENEKVLLVEGNSRNRYYFLDDATIYNECSASIPQKGAAVYAVEGGKDKLTCVDFYFTSADENNQILFYHNQTGDWDVSASEPFAGDEEAFWANMTSLASRIQFKELTAFAPFEG